MMYLPDATYRMQLNGDFNLKNLREQIDYLHQLGISTIYASPITRATTGSTHGYDVTDPTALHPEIGTEAELSAIIGILKEKKMGWLQDIVPNHMALTPENSRLMDVLERGPVSGSYDYFDINWRHPQFRGKLMLPVLQEKIPEPGSLKVIIDDHGFFMQYHDLKLSFSLSAFGLLLNFFGQWHGKDALINQLSQLITRSVRVTGISAWAEYKHRVFSGMLKDKECKNKIRGWLDLVNSRPNIIKQLTHAQYYILRHYREASSQLNYRRFFTVNSLICLQMEKATVFKDYHRMLKRLYSQQLIQGLRVDHIDGLADPADYLKQLRTTFGKDCYIVAEKILCGEEPLPSDWPLQGTTGYDLTFMVNRLFTIPEGYTQLQDWYQQYISKKNGYTAQTVSNRMKILKEHMGGEWNNLYDLAIAQHIFPEKGKWKDALAAFITCMPVYRLYPKTIPLNGFEEKVLQQTVQTAIRFYPVLKKELQYLLKLFKGEGTVVPQKWLPFLQRMMQFSGPVMAKGIEDTSFYTWNAFIARNEVGDAPDQISKDPIADFHACMLHRLKTYPASLSATATHDTKRGEDARVRLFTIAEDPGKWLGLVEDWFRLNRHLLKMVNRRAAPSRNEEYFIYQSLVAGFPPDGKITADWVERSQQYILKAIREAKVNTSWDDPQQKYEEVCMEFISGIFNNSPDFLKQVRGYVKALDRKARTYSLSQLLLKLTAPGIPDIYQGCELLDYSFVDPDNRRPVDYALRKQLLKKIQQIKSTEAIKKFFQQHHVSGADKLFICSKTLEIRRQLPDLFHQGAYLPLEHTDAAAGRISYARIHDNRWLIVCVPLAGWRSGREQTKILLPGDAPAVWKNLFTGEEIEAVEQQLPVSKVKGGIDVILLLSC